MSQHEIPQPVVFEIRDGLVKVDEGEWACSAINDSAKVNAVLRRIDGGWRYTVEVQTLDGRDSRRIDVVHKSREQANRRALRLARRALSPGIKYTMDERVSLRSVNAS